MNATAAAQGEGGMVTYVLGLIRGWKDAGFDDRWILTSTADLARIIVDALGDLGEIHLVGTSAPLSKIAVQQVALPLHMARRKPDVLLSVTPVVPLVSRSTPVVAVVHDLRHLSRPQDFSRFDKLYRRGVWTAGLKRATRLIADSGRTRLDLQRHYPFADPKTTTVYLGCDHVPDPLPPGETGHGIAFARWANKRPDFAIRTWAELQKLRPDPDRRLHVVGVSAEERPRLKALAGDLRIPGLVVIHPFLPEEEFWQLFGGAGVVLFPSFFEGFGLPVLEAFRLRVPVVTWSDPALVEVAGDCAWYAEPSPEAFAAEVAGLLARPEETGLQVERAFERSCEWTWRKTADKTRAVLLEAIAAKGAAGASGPGDPPGSEDDKADRSGNQ